MMLVAESPRFGFDCSLRRTLSLSAKWVLRQAQDETAL
jgi:hypothetical protein